MFALCAMVAGAAPNPAVSGALQTERLAETPAYARPLIEASCAFQADPHCEGIGVPEIVNALAAYVEWLCLDIPGQFRCEPQLRRWGQGRFGAALEVALRAHVVEACRRGGSRPGCAR